MKTKRVYLAGPITGLSYEESRFSWRETIAEELQGFDHIELYSPMRGKDFLKGIEKLPCVGDFDKNPLSTPKGIISRDFDDVKHADLIVANFIGCPDRVSIGTVWELGAAHALQKPILLIMEKEGNPHEHWFISHNASYRVDNLEAAIMVMKAFLTPGI